MVNTTWRERNYFHLSCQWQLTPSQHFIDRCIYIYIYIERERERKREILKYFLYVSLLQRRRAERRSLERRGMRKSGRLKYLSTASTRDDDGGGKSLYISRTSLALESHLL